MRIHTALELRAIDRHAAEVFGVPTLLLMENAGRAVADAAWALLPPGGRVWVVSGKGNNGGDGWVAARHLHARGVAVAVQTPVPVASLQGDAAVNANAALKVGVPLAASLGEAHAGDVVIDAILGTGLTRAPEGVALEAIRSVAAARDRGALVLAVDLPSGLDADRPHAPGEHVVADATLTLHSLKPALCQFPARGACGRITVAPLGIPDPGLDGPMRRWLDKSLARGLLPARPIDAHKGTSGHLLVVAGSAGKSGAAMLACRAALRAGAGLVTLAAPTTVIERVLPAMPEVMGRPLESITREGLEAALERKTALAIGPGIAWNESTGMQIASLLAGRSIPAVLDADGLNAIASDANARARIADAKLHPVMTPHPAELARLLGTTTAEVQQDRFVAATEAAKQFRAHVVLKGACSVVAHLDGGLEVNETGNPAMATAGTGDVLTGVIGALLAQGLEGRTAAIVGTWTHGRAGDLAAGGRARGLVASDLIDRLPEALEELS